MSPEECKEGQLFNYSQQVILFEVYIIVIGKYVYSYAIALQYPTF